MKRTREGQEREDTRMDKRKNQRAVRERARTQKMRIRMVRSGDEARGNEVGEPRTGRMEGFVVARPGGSHAEGGHMEWSGLKGHVMTRPRAVGDKGGVPGV